MLYHKEYEMKFKIPNASNADSRDVEHFRNMNARYENINKDRISCDHELTKISYKYKDLTDKGPDSEYWRKHCYTEFYGPLFNHLREKPINMLEIGVNWGGSILMWDDFLNIEHLCGVDINLSKIRPQAKSLLQGRDNIKLIQGNAYQKDFFNKNFGDIKYDIILDDGSHTYQHQVKFFNNYINVLAPNGFLLCEDFRTVEQARAVIEDCDLNINRMSLIKRNHCIPSGKGEIIVMYRE